jgi:hypothetical protein
MHNRPYLSHSYVPFSTSSQLTHRSLSGREEGVLIAQILAAIRLPEHHNRRRIQPLRLGRAPRRHTKSERDIGHVVDDDAGVLRAVLPPPHVCLDDVRPVQVGHLARRLHPDLVPRVRCDHRQRCDVKPELSGLGELAYAWELEHCAENTHVREEGA